MRYGRPWFFRPADRRGEPRNARKRRQTDMSMQQVIFRRVFRAVALGLTGALLLATGLCAQEQPIPYSHKTHLAMGLKCNSCHKNADPGEFMGFPAESFCMSCHQTVKTDSPHIQKLAAAAKENKPLPWVRVYRIPNYVTSATGCTRRQGQRAKRATDRFASGM
jgi:hypothetical protein